MLSDEERRTRSRESQRRVLARKRGEDVPYLPRSTTPLLERLMSKVRVGETGECWPWNGSLDREGYGRIWAGIELGGPAVWNAHRVAYALFVGPIPDGHDIDHECHNDTSCSGGSSCQHRACVNPAHLGPATRRENTMRSHAALSSINARKVKCDNGHPFTDENTYVGRDGRSCRACHRERERIRRNGRRAS